MKPLDPRLLRYAAASRSFLVIAVFLGLAQVTLVIIFSWLLASVLARAAAWVGIIGQVPPAGTTALLPELLPALWGLAAVVTGRVILAWAVEFVAARAAVKAKSQLRLHAARALAESLAAGQGSSRSRNSAHAVTVLGSGLDALDTYFSRYLPQLVLTALAIPLHLGVLATQDLTTAVIVALTLPLIPLFMVLIGYSTQAAQQRQFRRLDRLSRTYLDLIEGLSTLKVFNRQHHQRENLRELSEGHRRSTMKVLRVSFLSGFVLELAASLSVALVAVSVGIRLIDGQMELLTGLFVLLIVPEAYAPLRQVGANYHAAADGVAAAEDVFEILEEAPAGAGTPGGPETLAGGSSAGPRVISAEQPAAPPGASPRELILRDLGVRRGDTPVIEGLSIHARAGELTVIGGPSGAGKSSLFAAVMGFLPSSGEILLAHPGAEIPTPQLAGAQRRELIAWSGQRHGLRSGTVLENITLQNITPENKALDDAAPPDAALPDAALPDAALPDAALANERLATQVLSELGLGPETGHLHLDQPLGVRGAGLSGGQAHRVAIARALFRARSRNCPVLLLDEPSAALDSAAEALLIRTLRAEAAAGRTVVVISHRNVMRDASDQIIDLPALLARVQA